MNRHCLLACSIAAGALLSAPLQAQTVIAVPLGTVQAVPAPGMTSAEAGASKDARAGTSAAGTPMPELKVHRSSSGTAYIAGGASVDVREAMDQRRSEFPLKVSVSACSGEYLVADSLSLSGPKGEFLSASNIGPIVMTKAPTSGQVSAKVSYKGETQTRSFAASGNQSINICFKQG